MSQKFRLIWTIVLLTEVFLYSVTSLSVQPKPELGNIIFSQKQKIETSVTKEQVVPTSYKVGWNQLFLKVMLPGVNFIKEKSLE